VIVAAINVRTDGGAWQQYVGPLTIQGDGTHPIEYYATDKAGNSESVHTSTIKIDGVAPVTTSRLDGVLRPDGSYNSVVNVTLTSADMTSGVQSIQYRVDSGAWWSYTGPFPLRGNGSHIFEYFATDVAGNDEAMHALTIRITGDVHILPVSSLASSGTAGANGWYVSLVYVTLSATGGAGTSIAYRVDTAPWRTYAGPFSITEGRHVFQFQASDGGGYLEPLRSTTIDIDYTPPAVVETTPAQPFRSIGELIDQRLRRLGEAALRHAGVGIDQKQDADASTLAALRQHLERAIELNAADADAFSCLAEVLVHRDRVLHRRHRCP